jgi:ABC-2 type transport system ATP-binding protein
MIEARHLTTGRNDRQPGLGDVSFVVSRGETYAMVGAAGAGKTSLARLFLGHDRPSLGQAVIDSVDVAANPIEARRRATAIMDGAALYRSMTVRRNVQFFARLAGAEAALSRSTVDDAMRYVGIPERYFDRRPQELGDGEALIAWLGWLAIARLRRTPALILDYPTSGLAAHGVIELQAVLRDANACGLAILVLTADVSFATQVAARIGILQAGRKVAERSRADVLDQSVIQFIGNHLG